MLPVAETGTHPRIRQWHRMTGADFRDLDPRRCVVMVTCSPLEVHGPHLPVVADSIEAEALSLRTMQILCEREPDIEILRLPPIYTAADVLPHPGSIMFRSSTIIRVLCDLGRSLGRQGFRHIWVSNFHGGPRHFVPIEVACDRTNRRHGTSMLCAFSLLIRRLTDGGNDLSDVLGDIPGLSAGDLAGDTHGGAIETSMLLHLIGDCVAPSFRDLEQMTVHIKLARAGKPPLERRGVRSLLREFREKLKYFESETYTGKPAIASAEIGRRVIEVLATHSADALGQVWRGEITADQCHSPLWPMRRVFTSAALSWAFERAARYDNRVF
jgi:creatinine amidohydrolase